MIEDEPEDGRGDARADGARPVGTSATITCPHCGAASKAEMPVNACRVLYPCPGCARTLRPRAGDCCVFCSYADKVCPPKADEGGL